MNPWHDIPALRITAGKFVAVVEIEKGSKMKYELDKQTGMLILDRVLYTSTHYPASYGFIPRTYGEDDDPLDVLVLCNEPIRSMSLVEVYPIGAIDMIDDGSVDTKIIAIPCRDPNYNSFRDIENLPAHLFDEMQHFFKVYKELEGKATAQIKLINRSGAEDFIKAAIERYNAKFA